MIRHTVARPVLPVLAAFALLAGGPVSSFAHDEHRHSVKTAPPADPKRKEPAHVGMEPDRLDERYQREYFTDLPLLTQDGEEIRFYTDMLKGKVVLISFIYTNCMDVCPILMPNLARIQELLGERSGKDVSLISISVDPVDDTPEELKKYGEKYGAKDGWTFLTGKKENVDWLVYKLGQYAEDFEDHSMLFLLGDVKNGRWAKMRGDMAPEAVTARLLELLGNW